MLVSIAVLVIIIITVIVVLVHRRRRTNPNLKDPDTAVVRMSQSDHGGDKTVLAMDGKEPFYATIDDLEDRYDEPHFTKNTCCGGTAVSNVGTRTTEVNSGCIHNG